MKWIDFFAGRTFSSLDRSLEQLQQIRDSYRRLNVIIYGEELARQLNDC
ncbi:hypothetical protein Gbem_1857 [Citrifermentans bemidjiense Bem]|uniref:Uncharacterized protein n=1 Tax=Citrifermentans bemidjiense (strain ATCC BAA-1014 / DSM 16622 / JCM 12645 / Bem) TaxID=404380 RepID=B5EB10_CITBB|nr:hypothetical protein [Citrifermentans bemidjiense]ACH38871.1 hypothetical protein Gbem_1857 [Citrifermentans bemidjiense Bem]